MRQVIVIEMNDDRFDNTPEIKPLFLQAIRNFEAQLETEVFVYCAPGEYDFHETRN